MMINRHFITPCFAMVLPANLQAIFFTVDLCFAARVLRQGLRTRIGSLGNMGCDEFDRNLLLLKESDRVFRTLSNNQKFAKQYKSYYNS